VNNILIVESENDQYFIEALSAYMNLSVMIDNPICNVTDYACLDGLGNFEKRLIDLPKKLDSKKIVKVGIILDADDIGIKRRIEFINDKLEIICSDVQLEKINDFKNSSELDVQIGCYIMNVSGKGELETVMKVVKLKDSTYADCLDSWKQCLEEKGKEISQKDFDKFWVSNYLKFDTCISSKHRGKKSKYCANEIISHSESCDDIKIILQSTSETMKKDIWDFENPILDELKEFLKLLSL